MGVYDSGAVSVHSECAAGYRKGQPWSEAEHRGFLKGLASLGKGNWRGISKMFVPSRSPTQVASHAQKHFLRVSSGATKRRSRFSRGLEQARELAGPPSPTSSVEDGSISCAPLQHPVKAPATMLHAPFMTMPLFALPNGASHPLMQPMFFSACPAPYSRPGVVPMIVECPHSATRPVVFMDAGGGSGSGLDLTAFFGGLGGAAVMPLLHLAPGSMQRSLCRPAPRRTSSNGAQTSDLLDRLCGVASRCQVALQASTFSAFSPAGGRQMDPA